MDRSSRVPSHIVVPTYKNRMEELDGYPRTTEQEKEVDERVGEDDVHETPQLADTTMEGQLMHPPAEKAAAADTQDESSQESTEASFAGTNPEEGLLLLGQMTQSSQQSQAFHQQQQFYPPGPSMTQQWEQATNLQNNPALRMEAWRANQFAHPPLVHTVQLATRTRLLSPLFVNKLLPLLLHM
jgi:predicted small lipoprotein YifL